MRIVRTLSVLLLSLGATAAFAAPKPVKNACSLAPAAESSAALKTQLKVGIEIDGMCIYNDAKGTAVAMVSASSLDTAALAGASFQYAGKDSVKPVEAVPGVGNEAKITYSNAGPMTLVVRKGMTILQVSILPAIGANLSGFKTGMIQIAKAAADRL